MTKSQLLMLAKENMDRYDSSLTQSFVTIIEYLIKNPEDANYKGEEKHISESYVIDKAKKFFESRSLKRPSEPKTGTDSMVKVLLLNHFGIQSDQIQTAIDHHRYAMGAENIIGDLLECYIAGILEPCGWVWCSGSFVKAIDFIKRDGESWIPLQVKNRDNSENSSSSKVREGTEILKWFRTFSQKEGDNWGNFPDPENASRLSEEGFEQFVIDYLRRIATHE